MSTAVLESISKNQRISRPTQLTPLEWRFMLNIVREGMTQKDAYLAIRNPDRPALTNGSVNNQACAYMRRIKKKIDWDEVMDLQGLDDLRLAKEVDLRLKAKTVKFHQDEELGEYADNGTRMQATKLLAELRGKTSSGINVSQTTNVQVNVQLSQEDEVQFEANIASMFND